MNIQDLLCGPVSGGDGEGRHAECSTSKASRLTCSRKDRYINVPLVPGKRVEVMFAYLPT